MLEWLAPKLVEVGGTLLQAEDELASINMIVGASFGGIAGAAERATVKAVNAGLSAARKATVREITTGYEVKRADVEAHLTLERARASTISGALRLKSGSLPLHYFPHTPDAPGTGGPGAPTLQVTVKRGQTKAMPGAFVATTARWKEPPMARPIPNSIVAPNPTRAASNR